MHRPPPPRPIPKPGQVKVVRALYKYTAQHHDELSFDEGDMLYIVDMQTDKNWWKAKCGDKTGLIPSNYVDGNTESIDHPLHEAVKRGNVSFMKECLNNKVSVNGLDKSGSTPLHWASHGGHTECVVSLLAVPNIQVNVQNKLGDTPLHSAAWKDHEDIVKLLLEKGAWADVKNNDGKSPYDLARDPAIAALLKPEIGDMSSTLDDYGDSDEESN